MGGGRGDREALSLPLPPALPCRIFRDSTGSGPSQCQDTGSYRTIEGHFLVSWSFTYICHQLSGLLGSAIVWRDCKRLGRQQRLLDTECTIVLNWQHPLGWGGKWWVRRGGPTLIVIVIAQWGWGVGVVSRSWEPELLGEGKAAAGTWLQA